MTQPAHTSRSVFAHSSRLGLPMGLYLSVMSAAFMGSVSWQPLLLLIFPLALGTPVLLYFLIHSQWRRDPMLHSFGAVWLAGIWTFIFGALICGVLTAAWIIFFEPDFVAQYISQTINTLSSGPLAAQYAPQIEQMKAFRDSGALPSPVEFVLSMMWSTAFFGSIVSLIIALIFRAKEFRTPKY